MTNLFRFVHIIWMIQTNKNYDISQFRHTLFLEN